MIKLEFVALPVKVGGSFMVTIPKEIVDLMEIELKKPVILKIEKKRDLQGFGMFRGVGPFTKEDELQFDV